MKTCIAVLILTVSAFCQTTYTTTQDGCGGKANQYCRVNVTNQNGQPFDLILDSRISPTTGAINTLAVTLPWPGQQVFSVHGDYAGFSANPDGTKNAYYGAGSFISDDRKVQGTFQFYAYYVKSCSGRACGSTIGWHFRVLTGSTVTN